MLNGLAIANNSYVDVDAIGENETALLCHTDKPDCCGKPNKAGEWYFPNETRVRIKGQSQDNEFYRDRGPQVVRLNRHNGSLTERGLFQCEIPDSSNMTQTVYVHIGILSFKSGPYDNLFVYSISSVLYTIAACYYYHLLNIICSSSSTNCRCEFWVVLRSRQFHSSC